MLEPLFHHQKTVSLSKEFISSNQKVLSTYTGNRTMLEPARFLKFKRQLALASAESLILCGQGESNSHLLLGRQSFCH